MSLCVQDPEEHLDGTNNCSGSDESLDIVAVDPGARCTFIFDWDDTLFPNAWLSSFGYRVDSPLTVKPCHQASLDALEGLVLKLLRLAARNGRAVILTNAESGWVELSSQKFLPRVHDFLRRSRL